MSKTLKQTKQTKTNKQAKGNVTFDALEDAPPRLPSPLVRRLELPLALPFILPSWLRRIALPLCMKKIVEIQHRNHVH